MKHLIPWIVLVLPILIGYFVLFVEMKEYNIRINEVIDYRNALINFLDVLISCKRIDNEEYIRLTKSVNKIQIELGDDGVMYMHDPLCGISSQNYQVLINFLPQSREYQFNLDNELWLQRFDQQYKYCDDALIRHIGSLEDQLNVAKRRLYNPIYAFACGIRAIIVFPFRLLYWFGLLSEQTNTQISNSVAIKIVTGLVSLVSFGADVISIIVGWDSFLLLFKQFFE